MFDSSLRDAQSTEVRPVSPEAFDFDAYREYAAAKEEKIRQFTEADSGVLVYRRFRVGEVFSYACRDRELSLSLQLGGLNKSMAYETDIPNFLEPWYGLGITHAAFGADYVWLDGQAPAVEPLFSSLEELDARNPVPIADTGMGKTQLAMIEYFMDKTGGRLPMSFGDIQSPLNVISGLLPTSDFFTEILEDPDLYLSIAERTASLTADFLKIQQELIGSALVFPGHGFASSTQFKGIGASDDTSIMISNPMFDEVEAGPLSRMCAPFGGTAYHSCGNWAKKIPSVLNIGNIVCADGAFSSETDPSPNDPAPFGEAFAGTGVILNARAVGSPDTVAETVKKLWHPGLKLIVNTYCKTPEEQHVACERIREICC